MLCLGCSWGHASRLVPTGTLGKLLFFASSNWLRVGEADSSSADWLSPQSCAGVTGGCCPAVVLAQPSALHCRRHLQGSAADTLPLCHSSRLAFQLRPVPWSHSRGVCEEGFGGAEAGKEALVYIFQEHCTIKPHPVDQHWQRPHCSM